MPLTEKELELSFKRFTTRMCDFLEMTMGDTNPHGFQKLKKLFVQESHELKQKIYRYANLCWEDGKRYRMSRREAEAAGLVGAPKKGR